MDKREADLAAYAASAETPDFDNETVRRAIEGDKEAFTVLFQKTYRRMFFVARRILSNDEDIYDALQIGYTKAYKYIRRVSPPESFYPWLAKTIENAARDVRHDIYPHEELTAEVEALPTPDTAEDSERRVMMRRALSDMEPRRAEVLALYYYDGLKLHEIAKLLGEPISTVHSRLKAAKNELIDLLAQRGIDRSFYSGGFFSAIAVALRSVLGTDILSAAVAQKMLDEVLAGKPGRLEFAAAKLVEKRRNQAILRIASLLMALVVAVTLLTGAVANGWFFDRSQSIAVSATTTLSPDAATHSTTAGTPPPTSATLLHSTAPAATSSIPGNTATTAINTAASSTPGSTTTVINTATSSATGSTTTTAITDAFVSDYRPGYANTAGNTIGNLMVLTVVGGQIALQDKWLYYTEGSGGSILTKQRTDGTGKQRLFEGDQTIHHLNVVGDWIYYCFGWNKIYRIRTDGSGKELLSAKGAYVLRVIGNRAYYSVDFVDSKGTVSLYHMDLTTRRETAFYTADNMDAESVLFTESEALFIKDSRARGVSYDGVVRDFGISASKLIGINGSAVYAFSSTASCIVSFDHTQSRPIASTAVSLPLHAYPLFYHPANGGSFIVQHFVNDEEVAYTLYRTDGVSTPLEIGSVHPYYYFDTTYVYFFNERFDLCRVRSDGSDYTVL